MKRRDFIRATALAGTVISMPTFARNISSFAAAKPDFPLVYFTQQDFVSTFPWGIRGDKVRILQQEVENELLNAETLAAFAFLSGKENASERLDEAWKLMLNSQNHDVHVCLADETGIDWCNQARSLAKEVTDSAIQYLTGEIGGSLVFNTLPWTRNYGTTAIPGFGYASVKAKKTSQTVDDRSKVWKEWFEAANFKIRLLDDGSLEVQIGADSKNITKLGYLTVFNEGQMLDSRDSKHQRIQKWLSHDGKKAYAEIEGEISNIIYVHHLEITDQYIDYETTLDYGDGRTFGPEPGDFYDEKPRRIHYYQHERKLCMNCEMPAGKTQMLQNSPFLTGLSDGSKSVESLHYVVMESPNGNMAHFNIGQSGYGYDSQNNSFRHVLSFGPKKYVYGRGKQAMKGKETHRYRFMPFNGDWRKMKLNLIAGEYQRELLSGQSGRKRSAFPGKGSFLQISSNTTMATALFEHGGQLYVRLWEWAGQKDQVTLQFGDAGSSLNECTHGLKRVEKLTPSFSMRPWEIKTVQLVGSSQIQKDQNSCCKVETLNREPEGWSRSNYFVTNLPKNKADQSPISGEPLVYFSTGYHDGFVKPMERPSKTMKIEMERIRSGKFNNYSSSWEIGGSCWVAINKNEPEYLESLKSFIKEGSIEILGGTWCEPFHLIISGESVIRQFLHGTEAIFKHLDTRVAVYSNQEHGTFAQMPQILSSFGLKAVVNRTQWAPYGYESGIDVDVAEWIGVDGSKILVIPRYNSMDYSTLGPNNDKELQAGSVSGHNREWRTEDKFKELRDSAMERGIQKPLMTMLEDIWAEEWRSTDAEMDFYASLPYVKFISIARYLDLFGVTV
ncbi:MAG TPA: hypothetical protein VFC65_10185 [Prolixibacteraceae bacterium]|nr:hypothetical protein [Prolixibacteraceae bacterium]